MRTYMHDIYISHGFLGMELAERLPNTQPLWNLLERIQQVQFSYFQLF